MSEPIVVQAVYENGVLKPTQPLGLAAQQVVQISLNAGVATNHPHITKSPEVCGGRPVVRGTRIPVKALVGHHRMKDNELDVLAGYPDLTAAQFYDALSYYYDHQAEIDADIDADELPELLKRFNLEINVDGVLSLKS